MRGATARLAVLIATLALAPGCGGKSSRGAAFRHSSGLIAFDSNQDGVFRIYVINAEGDMRQLTSGDDDSPTWSPDGRRILFVRVGKAKADGVAPRTFYVTNADGSGLRRISASHYVDEFPAWSPDGAKIAFTRYLGEDRYDIYVMNADGSAKRRLTSAGVGGRPSAGLAWSPDGKKIAFVRNRGEDVCDVYVIGADGSGERRLTAGSAPAWSPNRREIAFERPCSNTKKSDLYVMNVNGTRQRRLVRGGDPEWSPDGSKIGFMHASRGQHYPDIYVMNRDGSAQHRLTKNDEEKDGITWSQRGEEIAFAQTLCCATFPGWEIYVIGADGTHLRKLTDNGRVNVEPAWQPKSRQRH